MAMNFDIGVKVDQLQSGLAEAQSVVQQFSGVFLTAQKNMTDSYANMAKEIAAEDRNRVAEHVRNAKEIEAENRHADARIIQSAVARAQACAAATQTQAAMERRMILDAAKEHDAAFKQEVKSFENAKKEEARAAQAAQKEIEKAAIQQSKAQESALKQMVKDSERAEHDKVKAAQSAQREQEKAANQLSRAHKEAADDAHKGWEGFYTWLVDRSLWTVGQVYSAFKGMVGGISDSLDRMFHTAKTAVAFQSTVDDMNALEYAGQRAGITMGQVETMLGKVEAAAGKAIGPGKEGDKARQGFKEMGVDALALARSGGAEALGMVAQALDKIDDAAKRSRLWGDIGGATRGGQLGRQLAMLDQLKNGVKAVADEVAHWYGVANSEVAYAKIELAKEASIKLAWVWRGIVDMFTVEITPIITFAVEQFDKLGINGENASKLISGGLRACIPSIAAVGVAVGVVWDLLTDPSDTPWTVVTTEAHKAFIDMEVWALKCVQKMVDAFATNLPQITHVFSKIFETIIDMAGVLGKQIGDSIGISMFGQDRWASWKKSSEDKEEEDRIRMKFLSKPDNLPDMPHGFDNTEYGRQQERDANIQYQKTLMDIENQRKDIAKSAETYRLWQESSRAKGEFDVSPEAYDKAFPYKAPADVTNSKMIKEMEAKFAKEMNAGVGGSHEMIAREIAGLQKEKDAINAAVYDPNTEDGRDAIAYAEKLKNNHKIHIDFLTGILDDLDNAAAERAAENAKNRGGAGSAVNEHEDKDKKHKELGFAETLHRGFTSIAAQQMAHDGESKVHDAKTYTLLQSHFSQQRAHAAFY